MYIHKEKPRLCFGERFALTCSNVARSLWWLTLASISRFQVDIIITCILTKIRRARFESASQLYITFLHKEDVGAARPRLIHSHSWWMSGESLFTALEKRMTWKEKRKVHEEVQPARCIHSTQGGRACVGGSIYTDVYNQQIPPPHHPPPCPEEQREARGWRGSYGG